MKKFVSTLAIVIAVSCFTSAAWGQAAGLGGGRTLKDPTTGQVKRPNAQAIVLKVLAQLNLTEDQKSKVKDLVKENRKAGAELRKSVLAGAVTKPEAQAKRKAMRAEYLKSIKAILTPEQAKQFDPLLKEEVKKAREAAANPAGGTTASGTKSGSG